MKSKIKKMKRNQQFTNVQIHQVISEIVKHLENGDSLGLAVSKACGSSCNALTVQVKKTDTYLFILNKYIQKKKNMHFIRKDGTIKVTMS